MGLKVPCRHYMQIFGAMIDLASWLHLAVDYSVELLVQGRIPWMMLDARQICASKLFLAIVGSSRSITSTCMRSRPRALSSHSVEAARITLQHVPRHEPCQVVSLPDFVGNLRISVLLFVSRPHVLLFKGMRLFPTD